MSRRRTRRKAGAAPGMGLVPFMNLILILIPALLLSASLAQVAVIEASTTGGPDPETECETCGSGGSHFRPIVHLGEDGISLSQTLGHHWRTGPFLPRLEGQLPLEVLGRALREQKDADPEARELQLSADASIPYSELVQVMDATREDEAGLLFPELLMTASP